MALLAWYLVDVLLLAFGAVLFAVLLRALADPMARRSPMPGRLPQRRLLATLIGLAGLLLDAEVRAHGGRGR